MSTPTSLEALKDTTLLESLKDRTINYCLCNSALMVHNHDIGTAVHIPHTLLPAPMPRAAFEEATGLAELMNHLYYKVSHDSEFLVKTLTPSAAVDPFVGQLLKMYKQVYVDAKPAQTLSLAVNRSDYMFHLEEDKEGNALDVVPQQIEMNAIAAGFAASSTLIARMHAHILDRHMRGSYGYNAASVPSNEALLRMVDAMATTVAEFHKRHGALLSDAGVVARVTEAFPGIGGGREVSKQSSSAPSSSSTSSSSVSASSLAVKDLAYDGLAVVMLVQEGERNAVDQHHIEYDLIRRYGIHVLRRSFKQFAASAYVDPQTNLLVVSGRPIGLVYFRAAYTPKDFPSSLEWDMYKLIETSLAPKCPDLGHHLAGMKKVQQELARPGVLERFVTPEECTRLRRHFAGMWGLEEDDAETRAIVAHAIENPQLYVLKPQREGGGNNHWGAEMVQMLKTLSVAERSAFILMRKIEAKPRQQVLCRQAQVVVADCLSELGVYATLVGDSNGPIVNKYAGFLLRTKAVGVDEGGVAAGYAVLDTPLLYGEGASAGKGQE